ncbi:MAG: murein L,D-transpeptidase family protein [Pseudobdellovibrionaceae bacterium]
MKKILLTCLLISTSASASGGAKKVLPDFLMPILGPTGSAAVLASDLIGNLHLRSNGEKTSKTPSRMKTLPKTCTNKAPLDEAIEKMQQDGPAQGPAKKIVVIKSDRMMYLLNRKGEITSQYVVALGKDPVGHKQFEGDGKTPEGSYEIEFKNPKSKYYLSVRVSYPNKEDKAFAASQGKKAGGDIMIHGFPTEKWAWAAVMAVHPLADWTVGCIAVTNSEIEEIYKAVEAPAFGEENRASKAKTPIDICP